MDNQSHPKIFGESFKLPTVTALTAAFILLQASPTRAQPTPDRPEGLRVTFESTAQNEEDASFQTTAPNLWLYVKEGTAPTPFLPAGEFKATWTGAVWVPFRNEYVFSVVNLQGSLELKVNGEVILSTDQTDTGSDPIRLSKGTNEIVASFKSPDNGDASMRLLWENRDIVQGPIPADQLFRPETTASARQDRQQLEGRALFIRNRCANCHGGIDADTAIPELYKPGPDLTGIGSRRRLPWMQEWIQNPHEVRNRATMPKMLTGEDASEQADAIAAYLASLQSKKAEDADNRPDGDAGAGKKLFGALHCAACHVPPESDPSPKPHEIALDHVNQKFASDALFEFLKEPEAHYRWIRMPNFELTSQEAADLSKYLRTNAAAVEAGSNDQPAASSSRISRGKQLVQSLGCVNCHNLPVENKADAPSLSELASSSWDDDCLSATAKPGSKAPFFGFTAEERSALKAFGRRIGGSLARHVPTEYAPRAINELNCRQCHGQFEGLPELTPLGGKLKPEWMESFMAGNLEYKPRPWLDARMPKFPVRAEWLAHGLANRHGFPAETPEKEPVDQELAKIGKKLVAAQGGLACVNCHGVGSMEPLQVFESQGVNLAHTGERLHKSYFIRWMLNPLQVDPQTRMPAFFYDGQSPLYNVLDGDAQKQLDAIWHYLRLGDKMTPPRQ